MKPKLKPPTAKEKAAHAVIAELIISEFWIGSQITILQNALSTWRDRREFIRNEIRTRREALKP